jgi:hypothetical protein
MHKNACTQRPLFGMRAGCVCLRAAAQTMKAFGRCQLRWHLAQWWPLEYCWLRPAPGAAVRRIGVRLVTSTVWCHH